MSTNEHDDPLAELFGGAPSPRPAVKPPEDFKPILDRFIEENCPKCAGTGRWRGIRECFKCKGTGKLRFKTSADYRAKARQSSQTKKADARAAWAEEHKAEILWIRETEARLTDPSKPFISFDFPIRMREAIDKYGSLTDGQLAAVRKLMMRDHERSAERKAEIVKRTEQAVAIDVAKIEHSFQHARDAAAEAGEGVKWLRLRLDTFSFTPAGAQSKNAGGIYVKEGERYLGKVLAGKFIRSGACSAEQETRIVAAAADPMAAAKAYGLRTGSCSCCGRELTNRASIDLGIGPICAKKYGWIAEACDGDE